MIQASPRNRPPTSPWAPFRTPGFRRLWTVWAIANLCMWMCDVAGAWLMTSLSGSKLMVAMIQTCTTLPVFLLALPCGAVADTIDRRHGLLAAQWWATLATTALAASALSGNLSAPLLLALTFTASIATALRWPVHSALIPEVVTREALPSAIVLNGMAVNASRVLGPLAAGFIITLAGGAWVFALAAVLSLASVLLLWQWRYEPPVTQASMAPSNLYTAMAAGVIFARQSKSLRAVLAWSVGYFMSATALLALLPLVAQAFLTKGADSAYIYTLLFASLGSGAVSVGFVLHLVRSHCSPHAITAAGSGLLALCITGIALSHSTLLSVIVMFIAGAAWLATGNTLSIAAQLALSPELRARGMSLFLMAVMAGGAGGAAFFGAIADWLGLRPALLALAATGLVLCAILGRKYRIQE